MISLTWKDPNVKRVVHSMNIPITFKGEKRYGVRRLAEMLNDLLDAGIDETKIKVKFL